MSDLDKYLGRPYVAGKDDCFGLVREFYLDRYNIWLPNVARPDEFWLDPNLDLYELYKRSSFVAVGDQKLCVGDVLLMPLGTAVNTHAAVVVEQNKILHHLPGGLSSLDPLRPKWIMRANVVLRHPKAQNPQSNNTTQIFEVLDSELFRSPKFQEAVAEVLGPRDREVRSDLSEEAGTSVQEPSS